MHHAVHKVEYIVASDNTNVVANAELTRKSDSDSQHTERNVMQSR